METSDSEYFESADEDFYSDTDDKNIGPVSDSIKNTSNKISDFENLSVKDSQTSNIINKQSEKQINQGNNNNSFNKVKSENLDASTISKDHVDKLEKKTKPPKQKLAVKLGTKVKKSDLNLPEANSKDVCKPVADVDSDIEERKDPLEIELEKSSSFNLQSHDNDSKEHKSSKGFETHETPDNDWNNDDFEWGCEDVRNNVTEKHEKEGNIQIKEENMWEDDNWEPISDDKVNTEVENKNILKEKSSHLKDDEFNSGWKGWGNWGVSSLLNTATVGVTTITNHVSHGFSTVLESGIGVPEPEELARQHKVERDKTASKQSEDRNALTSSNLGFGLGNFVSGVSQITKLVETTGTKVISGGLDTLETVGKKTMEFLQEGDPGLKKKRAFLKIESDKPVLSHMLREAKEKAEQENKLLEEKRFAKKANYETLFDDHQGLVHLEALEMLSKQCDIKLQTLLESHSGSELTEMQETMSQVNELCELTEEEEEEIVDLNEIKEKLDNAISEMNVPISYDKLISTWAEAEQWLENLNLNVCDELELHEQAIDTLAQLTAIAVEQFHKIGELLLIKDHRSTADEADTLVQLTMLLTSLISQVATKLSNKLNDKASSSLNKDRISGLITNVYYEAANSSSYIKNAFQLLIPVLQVGAV